MSHEKEPHEFVLTPQEAAIVAGILATRRVATPLLRVTIGLSLRLDQFFEELTHAR